MKQMRMVSLLLTVVLALGLFAACGHTDREDDVASVTVTTLSEAKAAIADGHYEAAYHYLLTDTSDEASELRRCFRYVPAEATHAQGGEVYATAVWNYDDRGYPIRQEMMTDASADRAMVAMDAVHECSYNDRGDLLTHVAVSTIGDKTTRAEDRYTYDTRGNTLTEEHISSDGKWTKSAYTYDDEGNCLTAEHTHSDRGPEKYVFTYDAAGNRLTYDCTTDSGTIRSVSTYDEKGNRLTSHTTMIDGSWSKIVNTYDTAGDTVSEETTNSNGKWEKWYMDGTNKVTETRQADGSYTKTIRQDTVYLYQYFLQNDADVRWIETERTYDAVGNLLLERQWSGEYADGTGEGSGSYTLVTYDEKGNLLKEERYSYTDYQDFQGSATLLETEESYTYKYDADGRVAEKIGTAGRYDGCVFTYTYDALGRIATEERRDEDGSWERMIFRYRDKEDTTGNFSREYDRLEGNYLKFTLDDNGRVVAQEQAENGKVTKTECTFSPAGQVLTQIITDPTGAWHRIDNSYHENQRKSSEKHTYSDGTWTKETFDAVGHTLTKETDQGRIETYRWELRYYPDGISQTASESLTGCDRVMDSFEDQLYGADWT